MIILRSLSNAQSYLKEGITFELMDKEAYTITDNQSADQLRQARQLLFKTIDERQLTQF